MVPFTKVSFWHNYLSHRQLVSWRSGVSQANVVTRPARTWCKCRIAKGLKCRANATAEPGRPFCSSDHIPSHPVGCFPVATCLEGGGLTINFQSNGYQQEGPSFPLAAGGLGPSVCSVPGSVRFGFIRITAVPLKMKVFPR